MKQVITITTDFGDSFATSQLKAVIASLEYSGDLIENHSVSPYSIIEGAFGVSLVSKYSPRNAVHVGVVDPGVGSERRGIIIRTSNFYFLGPDNGLLYPAAHRDGIVGAWQILETSISEEISNTFHGRDVFIKAAVFLAQGKTPEDFGSVAIPVDSLEQLSFQDGEVLHIDYYGNIKVYFESAIVPGKILMLDWNGKREEIPVVKTFSDVSLGDPLAMLGSSQTLELAVNQESAASRYGFKVGDLLSLSYG